MGDGGEGIRLRIEGSEATTTFHIYDMIALTRCLGECKVFGMCHPANGS
jgi:hypothetical protein